MPNKIKKNVIIISEVFFPNESATSNYMSAIAFRLANKFNVHVICANNDGLNPDNELIHGVYIHRITNIRYKTKNIFTRFLRAFLLSFKLIFDSIKLIKKNTIVFVVTNPPLIPGVVALLCKLKGSKCIIRVDDVYPEAMIAANLIGKNNLLVPLLVLIFRGLYCYADKIIVLGRDMKEVISRNLKIGISIIPNWADTDTVLPEIKTSNKLINELGLNKNFIVLIAGNLGYVQGIDTIIGAAKILMIEVPNIKFLFIGGGAQEDWIRRQIIEYSLENVVLVGTKSKSEQNIFLNACDVALLALKPGMFGLGVPSRFYNYLAAGKPVIASIDDNSEVALVIEEHGLGWISHSGDIVSLASTIKRAYFTKPEFMLSIAERARKIADSFYSKDTILEKYEKLFMEI